jgi:DNA-binding NtrC family response regulator
MNFGRILVVEDDDSLRRVTQAQLEKCRYQTAAAGDADEALQILEKGPRELVLVDLNLPGMSGLELLRKIRADYPETTVVMVTAFGSIETAVEAMKSGAYDYLTKPVHPDELRAVVSRVLERHRLIEEVRVLRSTVDQKYGFENIIGRSRTLLEVLDAASRVAHSDATVLILGETGTGKELLAKAIHFNSSRKQQPFVVINCGSIPHDLLESELFGHIKGSFTGALAHKKGKVEIADGGTVFLDEIGEMPPDLQVRVLRLIQEREIEKVGSPNPQKVNVRIIAATHRNLPALVAEGKFREDLYYRLSVIPIELPPLRNRHGDIPEFVHEFFERSKRKHARPELQFPPSLVPSLENYPWPGNVRELENVIERIVLLCRSNEVTLADFPDSIRQASAEAESDKPPVPEKGISLEAAERDLIVSALRLHNWNQSQAARYLNISRKTLMYRMTKHKIEKDAPLPPVRTDPQGAA